jgi:hypothetical protein
MLTLLLPTSARQIREQALAQKHGGEDELDRCLDREMLRMVAS